MGQEKNWLFDQYSIVFAQSLALCSFWSFMFSERISIVFLLDNHGFRLDILWDGSIPVHSSDLTHGFQFCAGLMHLSCVHATGIKGRVVQDRKFCQAASEKWDSGFHHTFALLSNFLVPWFVNLFQKIVV